MGSARGSTNRVTKPNATTWVVRTTTFPKADIDTDVMPCLRDRCLYGVRCSVSCYFWRGNPKL